MADMLFYLLRVAVVLLRQVGAARLDGKARHEIGFRAWPWSCDFNLHVNNAQYLLFMELARWAFTVRTGLLRRVLRERVQFLVAGTSLLYRRPLPMWRRFSLHSQLVATDERWFYFVQEFYDHRGRLALRALLRAMARDRHGGVVEPRSLLRQDLPRLANTDELAAFEELSRQHLDQVARDHLQAN